MTRLEVLEALNSGRIGLEEAKALLSGAAADESVPSKTTESAGGRHATALLDSGAGRALWVTGSGPLEDARLAAHSVPPPGPSEITVEVKASAINFPDVMCVRGLYPTMPEYPFVPGFEVSGLVCAKGHAVSSFAVGDEVIALTGPRMGGHASHVNVDESGAVAKPVSFSHAQACSLPVVFSTVHYAFELGELAVGEHVLIQSATGGCGLVAMQLARLKQCVIYGTSSKEYKLELLRRFGVRQALDYRASDFESLIRRGTGGRGVDVVLNTVGGDAIQSGIHCLAPSGRYLELAVHALKASSKLDLSRLVHNQRLLSIDLRRLGLEGRFKPRAALEAMVAMLEAGEIVPIVSRVYPFHEIGAALRHASEGKHIGKIVISHDQDTMSDCAEQLVEAMSGSGPRRTSTARKTVNAVSLERNSVRRGQAAFAHAPESVAVIGMAGKFPMAADVNQFWDNIAKGRDCVSEVPAGRWSIAAHYDRNRDTPGKSYSKWMGVLDGAEAFDPSFFNIAPSEAEVIDPQQRLFMMACWHCIEDAGIRGSALSDSRCGVFVGCGPSDYGKDRVGDELSAQALMGAATSILAARISYTLNLKGPCLAIETACSSALVALAQACDSLASGNCDLALAGGVYLMFGPAMHIMTSRAGMLSPDGRCFAFDERANGFVPGEGVGVLLLKRLSDATRDGDPIIGILRAWGVNQDGRTNGITAPSAKSQAALETEVYERFSVDPGTITLAEAHGTGTRLGDPIEVEALTEAFRRFTSKSEFCAIGSVKSNIGHLMTAAGISGVIKVLLALRHRALPPTIHFTKLNSHVPMVGSPFFLNTSLKPWVVEGSTPRRACVSSFGFSGTNAHLVLEEPPAIREHEDVSRADEAQRGPVVFVLSARSEASLRAYAAVVRDFVSLNPDVPLRDLAYTFQVGREAMDHRLAAVVDATSGLFASLGAYCRGEARGTLWTGKAARGNDGAGARDETGPAPLHDPSHEDRALVRIARLWVEGADVEWERLYTGERPNRVHAPGYPFSTQEYRLPVPVGRGASCARLHPLLHSNRSDVTGLRYSAQFTGEEWWLDDHRVNGERVLPGVAYLEMARVAARCAWSDVAPSEVISITNVVWLCPLVVRRPMEVQLTFRPMTADSGEFEVSARADGDSSTVHCRGEIRRGTSERRQIDVVALRAASLGPVWTRERCYEALSAMGLGYGPSYQAIARVYGGDGFALAELGMPAHLAAEASEYVLHPSVVDAALQAAIRISSDEQGRGHALPFAVEEVVVYEPPAGDPLAYVRAGGSRASGSGVDKVDAALLDSSGRVCVAVRGLSMRAANFEARPASAAPAHVYKAVWSPSELPREREEASQAVARPRTSSRPAAVGRRVVVLCEMDPEQMEFASSAFERDADHCLVVERTPEPDADRFADATLRLLDAVRAAVRETPAEGILFQLVARQGADTILGGLGALLKTAALEYPRVVGQEVRVARDLPIEDLVRFVNAEAASVGSRAVLHEAGGRRVRAWVPAALGTGAPRPWKDDGVYVISGGTGGLGLLVAEAIAGGAARSAIVLLGRSEPTEGARERMSRLAEKARTVVHKRVNVSDRQSVERTIAEVVGAFGRINGVVHAAGVVRDAYIASKAEPEVRAVLAPKVAGIVNLDWATRSLPLDFFVTFASLAGALGNPGQSDYAAANGFMDAYSSARVAAVARGMRHGRTLSVDWSFWRDGGMRLDGAGRERMLASGLAPLETGSALQALYDGLASAEPQLLVIAGDPAGIGRLLSPPVRPSVIEPSGGPAAEPREADDVLVTKVEQSVVQQISSQLKLRVEDVDLDAEFSELGFDSISLTDLASRLRQRFGFNLVPTVFFEHPTVRRFARHLVTEHSSATLAAFGLTPVSKGRARTPEASVLGAAVPVVPSRNADAGHQDVLEPVAVIGMSGCFPMARDLDAFWENLRAGRDCIVEIPSERWDWREYYGQPSADSNKTKVKFGAFIDGVGEFDPLFFGISPSESELMDPQQRLLMTHAYLAIEDAGYSPQSLAGGNVAIYVGTGSTGYASLLERARLSIKGNSALGSVPSVGPNRMSYFLDLHGPSEPVETACSSSLVAVHRALTAIHAGECDAAIVGGVNTILTPDAHIGFAKAGMLSEDGRCKTFSARADGYVRGEGVGMLFLKRLSAAERDGDPIYGVLRASAVNHGGRTNSLTAPSPQAQADLIVSAWSAAGVDTGSVGYIEAHGTGTQLGDPIEINGLKQAFRCLAEKSGARLGRDQIGIGSVKSNIGHLELAAGVAGLIKVLLQMRHQTIVETLHCQTVNPYIDLEGSPFYIARSSRRWDPMPDAEGRPMPRRAGVSSFGFGGVNAHVVVEEHVPRDRAATKHGDGPALIVLSARTEAQLRRQSERLLSGIERAGYTDDDLESIAYTLQVGRDAMEERLGVAVRSLAELKSRLVAFLEGDETGVLRGQVKRHKDVLAAFAGDEDLQAAVSSWLDKRRYERLLSLWVKGLTVDWKRVHGASRPTRVRLPGYAFANERYWVPTALPGTATGAGTALHPLLQENTSTLQEQRYRTVFDGTEFFLAHHRVFGKPTLPAVAYVEMVRAAWQRANPALEADRIGARLTNVVWARPFVVDGERRTLEVTLVPDGGDAAIYEARAASTDASNPGEWFSRGVVRAFSADAPPTLDVQRVIAQCGIREIPGEQCYEAFAEIGLTYGPAQRGLARVHVGDRQAIAELRLPEHLESSLASFVAHPSLLDSALQASIALATGIGPNPRPGLPFAVEEVEIFGACPARCWAWVREAAGESGSGDTRIDIDLVSESGDCRVRVKRLALRPVREGTAADQSTPGLVARAALAVPSPAKPANEQEAGDEDLLARVRKLLVKHVARSVKVTENQIDLDTELGEYGFDSITLTELAGELNQGYGLELTPTTFFEWPTVRGLSDYLAREYRSPLLARLAAPVASPAARVPAYAAPETTPTPGPIATKVAPKARFSQPIGDRIRPPPEDEPIAIIGMSGRFPMAPDLERFWSNLCEGKDCIQEVPPSRWDWREYYGDPTQEPNKTNIKWGGFIEGIEDFDSLFFGISPAEAEAMDPQQRLLMTYAWHAIEDAGYSASDLAGSKTAVFVGTGHTGYGTLIERAGLEIKGFSATGAVPSLGPNRVSYFLNLRGPSEPVETACSSSLVALHKALLAMRASECDMAIVGGVNTIVTPASHIGFSKAGMLAEDGRCKTFSDKADGYVRGEGVGMLVLKRLSLAEAAGDHIYGLLRGSAVDHGGRTGSLTAPSPKSQAELLQTAYRMSGVDVRTITFVEAHGTGTELGDPIEVEALKTAFGAASCDDPGRLSTARCALSSVKTNIGHLELAAGIAGVIKVLLQMKHRTLVKSLHCERVNPYIRLDDSPFYIVRETREWAALRDGQGRAIPRRAGVSSFGFGGVNAHVVLEEYVSRDASNGLPGGGPSPAGHLMVLSAKNEARLAERARDLLAALDAGSWEDGALPSVAYTLQVGREPMDERLGMVVRSIDDLKTKLRAYVDKREAGDDMFRGQARRHKQALGAFADDEDIEKAIESWMARGKFTKLLDAWTHGLTVNWGKLWHDERVARVSLPTYPFAKERCWVPVAAGEGGPRAAGAGGATGVIHPLVHKNASDLVGLRYRSRFTGDEFFFRDHRVAGKAVLPGVACLEMARAAMADACAVHGRVVLRNVTWLRPIVAAGEPLQLEVGLKGPVSGQVLFEVYAGDDARPVLYCQGSVEVRPEAAGAPVVDLARVRATCTERTLDVGACYEAFSAAGLAYGPAFRGLAEMHVGAGGVLAKVVLPESAPDHDFVLHPSLIDAALQAVVGLEGDRADGIQVPFAVDEVEVWSHSPREAWVTVSVSAGGGAGGRKVDLALCDERGAVFALIRGFSARPVRASAQPAETLFFRPVWREIEPDRAGVAQEFAERRVLWIDGMGAERRPTRTGDAEAAKAEHRSIELARADLDAGFAQAAGEVFAEIKRIAEERPRDRVLLQCVVDSAWPEQRLLRGLSGLLRTARLEHPRLHAQLVEMQHEGDRADPLQRLEAAAEIDRPHVALRDGRWLGPEWDECSSASHSRSPWRDGGTYLIAGGAGGLGRHVARAIAHAARAPNVVLVGRSADGPAVSAFLEELHGLGARAQYRSVDVADLEALRQLVGDVLRDHGALHGVIHAAGVVDDGLIKHKSREAWDRVVKPKIAGLVNLDVATENVELDWLVLFSSYAGVMGNRGQSDYATGNAFLDAFAEHRNALVAGGRRRGRTVSIAWPLWRDGGMRIDARTERLMEQTTGLRAMDASDGIAALHRVLARDDARVMILCGDPERLRKAVRATRTNHAVSVEEPREPGPDSTLSARVKDALRAEMARILKVDPDAVDGSTELGEYGFDSITITELTTRVNRLFGLELAPPVFFEFPTLDAVAEHLASAHRRSLSLHFGAAQQPVVTGVPAQAAEAPVDRLRTRTLERPGSQPTPALEVTQAPRPPTPLAVIGMSGCFPGAPDIERFWKNLDGGIETVQEVPEARWSWREFYGDPHKEANRTRIKWGGFIDGIDEFDPLFFGISPREARVMDPQQRLLMTHLWSAIEDAGYAPSSLSGTKTAIFVGTGNTGYSTLTDRASLAIQGYSSIGVVPSIGPNRMSFFLNLRGPSEPIETACSSSLVAIHRAMQAIDSGRCDMALVGGVNTIVTPAAHIGFDKAGMLSEDGRCKPFSDRANGYVRGEGAGVLFLKRLSDAISAGDPIYGVIRSSSENHGGRATSLTAPNVAAQAELIEEAHRLARIDPRTVGYVEAHGTGTELGDPIEIDGLKRAFAALYREVGAVVGAKHCSIGSVKGNIGHLELAAGVASVIKVLLQMKHRRVVRSLHCERLNPYIDLEDCPFTIAQHGQDWPAPRDTEGRALPRRAGISSFGFGGVNAHVLLEEYPAPPVEADPARERRPVSIVLSAKNLERLRAQALRLADSLAGLSPNDLVDVAYTLQIGRDPMDARLGLVVDSIPMLERKLRAFAADEADSEGVHRGRAGANRDGAAVAPATLERAVQAFREGRLAELTALWVGGCKVDWDALYGAARPRRLHLPTYAFARDRYWVPAAPAAPREESTETSPGGLGPASETGSPKAADPASRESTAGGRSIMARLGEDLSIARGPTGDVPAREGGSPDARMIPRASISSRLKVEMTVPAPARRACEGAGEQSNGF